MIVKQDSFEEAASSIRKKVVGSIEEVGTGHNAEASISSRQ